jgi:hypothetical protein
MLSQISTRFVTDDCREEVSTVRSVVLPSWSTRLCHLAGGRSVLRVCGAPLKRPTVLTVGTGGIVDSAA